MPVLRNMQEEEANMSMMAKLRQYLDPTTTVFVVRSLLRVVLIFLLMVVLSASYTYMAVYVYARGPLLDTHGGITSYERTGSYSSTSYLGAIVTDYMGRSIAVSYTHLRAHETVLDLVCRLLLEKKKKRTIIYYNAI
eukprot:TRINITY_DN28934_c0_g1_i1.p1 TRINITY_DN28934_c0_g1~~TRINITY_DN28934_c0_g1_i1.p1  ORF type:complete len:137 (-),score=27.76 TRINITY_DN28934_c0_g1_i1:8-418(-)